MYLLIVAFSCAATLRAQEIRVTLLGTGNPPPTLDRFGPSTLVQAAGQTLVFDAGRGVAQRLYQLNVPFSSINAVFLTHLHSDHVVGLPDLWLTGWLVGRRTMPLNLVGPSGTAEMAGFLEKAFSFDVRMRIDDDHRAPAGGQLAARDIEPGIVYNENGVKVTAFEVDHSPVKPAFGYKVEYAGHTVVMSGDTKFFENVINYATGADLLIHEVVLAPAHVPASDPTYPAFAHHTTPEQAAEVFSRARPKLAVYSHVGRNWGLPEDDLTKRTRLLYSGPVLVGEDLMSFVIGDQVRVERPGQK